MYRYNPNDRRIVAERQEQYRNQTERYLAGQLSDDAFRPLRLQNGLYFEKHNPMLRIAVPYGEFTSSQARVLAQVARQYDRGYGHFTTRHNFQLNWVKVEAVPDLLADLARHDMHAIQSSGSCMRVVTTDPLAGVDPDAVADPRPWAELFRQWSTLHPEFAALPRKFKIAFTGSTADAANVRINDLGFELVRNAAGELGFRVWAGGGLGRNPYIGKVVREFLPWQELLTYSEALLRVYNLYGRRDKLFKSRIKILLNALGLPAFIEAVENEWQYLRGGPHTLTEAERDRVAAFFSGPDYEAIPERDSRHLFFSRLDSAFGLWLRHNTRPHRVAGYAAVILTLKSPSTPPGNIDSDQLDRVADLADAFSFGELRSSEEQNLIMPHVRKRDLYTVWQLADAIGLATPVAGLLADVVSCPGGDLCSLANARSVPLAQAIQRRFSDVSALADIGPLRLNISGCVNACGHHHIGAIGILGVDKAGQERYQMVLGGRAGSDAALARVIGPSLDAAAMETAVVRMIEYYRRQRQEGESFNDTLNRIGRTGFIEAAYRNEPKFARTEEK